MQKVSVGATSKLTLISVRLCIPTLANPPVFRPILNMHTLYLVDVSEICLQ